MQVVLDPALVIDQPVAASFAATTEFGYDGVEIGNRDDFIPAFKAVQASREELAAARRQAVAVGTEITSVAVIQSWSSPDEDRRAQAVAWWLDGIDAAVELGCRRINTELSGDPNAPAECRAAFLRSVETLLPSLEREGIVVAVEPHPWDFIETTEEAVALIEQVDSPHLRYLHCLPHTFHLGGTVTAQVERSREVCDHLHLADTFRPERTIINPPGLDLRIHQHFDIGDGELDWEEAGRALAGFNGIATVQVFFWGDRAARSFHANRAAVDRIFEHAEGGASR